MKIYYLLYQHYTQIVGVFGSLSECFNWKPETPPKPPMIIKEVKEFDDGRREVNTITTSEHHWTMRKS